MKLTAFKSLSLAVMIGLGTAPIVAQADYERHHYSHHYQGHHWYQHKNKEFRRIASFPVYLNSDIDQETVAEIVSVSEDGKTLVYTDGKQDSIGFVDIRNPHKPQPAGLLNMGGETTSVAVSGQYALVGVNTSPSFIAPSGELKVVDMDTQAIAASIDLGGQPDSVAVSPDGQYAAVVIENERDEDLGNGEPPQAPGGFMVIIDMLGEPGDWTSRTVDLSGIADVFPEDPEPEYVDINEDNLAVVTLQENNYLALVDMQSGSIVNHFSAGLVDLDNIDIDDDGVLTLQDSLSDVPREPDGVSWISNSQFATADEGDLFGGSRGFTVFNTDGSVAYAAGNQVEHIVAQHGHYPDNRADNKGNEPENVEYAQFGKQKLLFVGSERASVVLVYEKKGKSRLKFKQLLPTSVKPEGLLAIPSRGLFVAAGEEDARDDKIRSAISIYKLSHKPNYPTVISKKSADNGPITWGALSGLAIHRFKSDVAFAVQDSFYKKSAILKMKLDQVPAKIKRKIELDDSLTALAQVDAGLVNDDMTVNLDPEGIATRASGGFWIVSEGAGNFGDEDRPIESLNLLLKVKRNGLIQQVVTLPESVNARQQRFGFEGVASVGKGKHEKVYVAFQREWSGDTDGHVRIGQYNTASGEWKFFYYPIDSPESANGGWVGLSDIAYLGDDEFAVIERDNQGGPDAAIKRIYKFSIDGLTPLSDSETPAFPVVHKTLARDLMDDLQATGGLVLEKIEGLAVNRKGDAYVVNDNDGVDDSNGETQLMRFKRLFK